MQDTQNKVSELLGHKRKKSNEDIKENNEKDNNEENNNNNQTNKSNICEESQNIQNKIKSNNNAHMQKSNISNINIMKVSNKLFSIQKMHEKYKYILEEKEDICQICIKKKKVLYFKEVKKIFEYILKEKNSESIINDLKEKYMNVIFDKNKIICKTCLNNLIKNKNDFENFINNNIVKEKEMIKNVQPMEK